MILDKFERVLKVGDMIVFSSMESTTIDVGMIHKIKTKRVYVYSNSSIIWKIASNTVRVEYNETFIQSIKDKQLTTDFDNFLNQLKFKEV